MLNRNWVAMLIAVLFVAGCATTGGDNGAATADNGQQQAADTGVETGTAAPTEQAAVDPLDDPSSPLQQRSIYFGFDRTDIPEQYLDLVDQHAQYLIAHPDVKVRLEGNTDERGTREYNIGLGDRRAQSVRRMLLFQGVANNQVETVSYGEERPADEGHDEAAYAKNRRVDIVYLR